MSFIGVSFRGRAGDFGGVGFAILGAAGVVTGAGGTTRGVGFTADGRFRVVLAVCFRWVAFGTVGASCGARKRDRGIVVGGSFSAARLAPDGLMPILGLCTAAGGSASVGGADGKGSIRIVFRRDSVVG